MIEYTDEQHDSLIRGHRKQLADAQATVEALQAQLEQEREKVKGLHEVTRVICTHCCEPMEIPSKAVLQTQLTQLQALVRALPVVKGKFEVGSGVFYYVRALDGKENPVVCGLMTEQATAFAIKALLAYRATLDTTTPVHEPGCPAICDDEGDQVLEDCGQCTCEAVRSKGGDGE